MIECSTSNGRETQTPTLAPGPRGWPLLGSLPDVGRDPIGYYEAARRQHGDVVRFRSNGKNSWHYLAHPDDIEYILQSNWRNYAKGFFFSARLKLLTGDGLFTSEGDFWLRQRRLTQPAFHRQRLDEWAKITTDATEVLLRDWQPLAKSGEAFDVTTEMMRLTLQVVGRTLFSTDLGAEAEKIYGALTIALDHISYRMFHPLSPPENIPTPRNRRFRNARQVLDDVSLAMIRERRAQGTDTGDLLSMLLLARDEDTGEGMDDRQLRDEIMTILMAGHETTAVALSWAWWLLSENPEVWERLQAELDTALSGRTPGIQDVPNLPYTRMIIQEAMRVYPPIWAMTRQAVEDDTIRGYHIKAGSTIIVMQYITHRHPEFWPNPERFDPENFAPEVANSRPRFAYFPFGGGPRGCLGNNFAMMEAQLILAMIAQRHKLVPVKGQQVVPEPSITLRPRNGIMMTLK